MLRLFGRRSERAKTGTVRPSVPDGTRAYAVGDIHGRLDLLHDLLRQIEADRAQHSAARHVLIFLGDYIDRGTQSRAVVEFLRTHAFTGFETHYLRGNHEQIMLDFLREPTNGPMWLRNGGAATLASYGVPASALEVDVDAIRQLQIDFSRALPDEHLAFLRGLESRHTEGSYFFVHAGVRPGVPLDEQDPHDLIWMRGEFLNSKADHGAIIVHGHSIQTEPEIRANRIGIDTGAYGSGTLTCLVLEGEGRWLIQT